MTRKPGTFKLKGNTRAIYVPADAAKDSWFPLRPGRVLVEMEGEALVIRNADMRK